jgi:hypothetical protein
MKLRYAYADKMGKDIKENTVRRKKRRKVKAKRKKKDCGCD